MLVITAAAFLLVIGMMLFKFTRHPEQVVEKKVTTTQPSGVNIDLKKPPTDSTVTQVQGDGNDHQPECRGGRIILSPKGGTYQGKIEVNLTCETLKSSQGDHIPSNIYFTTDESEPTKKQENKYRAGQNIVFDKPGKYLIKAKLFSITGKYEGRVYIQKYTITKPKPKTGTPIKKVKPGKSKTAPIASASTTIDTIERFSQLDKETREDMYACTSKIVFEAGGIKKVEKNSRRIKMQIFISQYGNAKMEAVHGFSVIPKEKINEVKAGLARELKSIKFLPPTKKGKPVNVKIWIDFKKIALLKKENQIMLKR